MNNTVADISVLEGLQANANANMGAPLSPMMMFNAQYKVVDAKKAEENAKEVERLKKLFEEIESSVQTRLENKKLLQETARKAAVAVSVEDANYQASVKRANELSDKLKQYGVETQKIKYEK